MGRKDMGGQVNFTHYADDPAGFARDILGSHWWEAQSEVAELVTAHRRVAVKAANGVGKTYLAADLVLWFLYSHAPAIVLTTAPTWRQVESLLWEEIRRRHRAVNARAELTGYGPTLGGEMLQTRLKLGDGHFALGLSTDEAVRFQGYHAENLLAVLDEACGIDDSIWEAVEGVCVGANNRVLAFSNPLKTQGRFYELFRRNLWPVCTISALEHPNVTGKGENSLIPGAVTRQAIADRVAEWCEPIDAESAFSVACPEAGESGDAAPVLWQGRLYRPSGPFQSRVLGEFPESDDESLQRPRWIDAAMRAREKDETTQAEIDSSPLSLAPCLLAVDVARFGSDETAVAIRRGDRVTRLVCWRGASTTETVHRVRRLAEGERAGTVLVDEGGVGGGVVDDLRAAGLAGVVGIQFGSRPETFDAPGRFLNRRAQMFWRLRVRLEQRALALPDDDLLRQQLAGLRYEETEEGLLQIESKRKMRGRGLSSPDRADAVAMLCALPDAHDGASVSLRRVEAWPQGTAALRPLPWTEVELW